MNSQRLEELVQKAKKGDISDSEKLELMRELNNSMEQYNQALRGALDSVPTDT